MSSLAVMNAGLIASGDLACPVLKGNCVLVEDGEISEIGDATRLNAIDASLPFRPHHIKGFLTVRLGGILERN